MRARVERRDDGSVIGLLLIVLEDWHRKLIYRFYMLVWQCTAPPQLAKTFKCIRQSTLYIVFYWILVFNSHAAALMVISL